VQARTPTSKKGVQVQAEITREWVTYRQAEEIAGLSRTTLRKLVADGEIQIRRVGRAVRINRASLDAYMNGDGLDAAR
jgi:excisionase family DNA binding protein